MGVVHRGRAVLAGMLDARVRPHRRHRLDRGAQRLRLCLRLLRRQARGGRPGARAGGRDRRTGVTVNAVCPGYTDTDMVRDSVARIVGQDRPHRERTRSARCSRTTRRPADRAGGGRRRRAVPGSPARAAPSTARRSPSPAGRLMMDDRRDAARCRDQGRGAAGRPQAELRLWLRLLTCTTLIESEVRRRLREQFGITLPRFDLMAQLDRAPDGMTLGELSQRMMVSNGNVTGLVDRLVEPRPDRAPRRAERPPRADRQADRRGPPRLPRAWRAPTSDWVAEIFAGLSPQRHRAADATARQDSSVGRARPSRRRRP